MRKGLLAVVTVIAGLIVVDYFSPMQSDSQIAVTVIALEDVPDGKGRRSITVELPPEHGGGRIVIETLTPFFYRPGYTAWLSVGERYLFPDTYDFIAPPRG